MLLQLTVHKNVPLDATALQSLELTVAICLGWLEDQSLLIDRGLLILIIQSNFCSGYHTADVYTV